MQDNRSIIKEANAYNLNRPVTGVIHQDRVWEKWYDPEIFKIKIPKMNQTDYLLQCNKGFEDHVIINNRGLKKLTVGDLQNLINVYSKALKAHNIDVGDVVATVALSTPELIALKYACGRIGAVTTNLNFKDISDGNFEKQLDLAEPKIVFVLDLIENIASEVLNKKQYNDVEKVILPLAESTPIYSLDRYKLALLSFVNMVSKKKIKNAKSLRQFLKAGVHYGGIVESIYEERMPSNIAFTSGTTGVNKAVLLSHDANNIIAWQHIYGGLNTQRDDKHLVLVPPFLAIWDADVIHAGMCIGFEEILELQLSYENVPKLLKKYSPAYGIWSQYLWDAFLTLPEETRRGISRNFKKVVVGGERADVNQSIRFYKMTGAYQEAGYGCTELNSVFTVAHPNCNVVGSAGIPLPHNNVRIRRDGNDLTYNERGLIYATGISLMNGYYKNSELTKRALCDFGDGSIWYRTGDYGFVDETGSLTVLDRYDAPIIINSSSVQKSDIAELLNGYFGIKICKVDYYEKTLVCHVVFDNYAPENNDELAVGFIEYINNYLPVEYWPHIINVIKEMPRTAMGKVDYVALSRTTVDVLNNSTFVSGTRLNLYQADS